MNLSTLPLAEVILCFVKFKLIDHHYHYVGSSGQTTVISAFTAPSALFEISTTDSFEFVNVNVVAPALTSVNFTSHEFFSTSPFVIAIRLANPFVPSFHSSLVNYNEPEIL